MFFNIQKFSILMNSISSKLNEHEKKLKAEIQSIWQSHSELKEKFLHHKTVEKKVTVIKEKKFDEIPSELMLNENYYLEKVRQLIKEYIQKYDADKTGLPDYALESSGKIFKFF